MIALSVVVLAWDQIHLTERCVESLRAHTDVEHEVIVVDNGSAPDAAARGKELADTAVLNEENLGFAAGMNKGLEASSGEYVAFVNNDTVLPVGWASALVETFESHPAAGIVVPAVTAAGNPVTVRDRPGTLRVVFTPYSELPSGVVYVMRAEVATGLGGWNEGYPVATGEDIDLLFTAWANDLDVVLDERVLVEHESQGTLSKLEEPWVLQAENLVRFLDRWASDDPDVPRLESCPPEIHRRNLRAARAAAVWMRRYVDARDRAGRLERQRAKLAARAERSWLDRLVGR